MKVAFEDRDANFMHNSDLDLGQTIVLMFRERPDGADSPRKFAGVL